MIFRLNTTHKKCRQQKCNFVGGLTYLTYKLICRLANIFSLLLSSRLELLVCRPACAMHLSVQIRTGKRRQVACTDPPVMIWCKAPRASIRDFLGM